MQVNKERIFIYHCLRGTFVSFLRFVKKKKGELRARTEIDRRDARVRANVEVIVPCIVCFSGTHGIWYLDRFDVRSVRNSIKFKLCSSANIDYINCRKTLHCISM